MAEVSPVAPSGSDHLPGPADGRSGTAVTVPAWPLRGVRVRNRTLPSPVVMVGWLASFVALVALFYAIARRIYGGDSDGATIVLQGQAVLGGNPLLHGWQFLLDSWWTVDVPFYTVGVAVLGVSPVLLFLLPAIFAALVVLVGIGMTTQHHRGAPVAVGALAVLALIGLPSGAWAQVFLRAGWHTATVLYCLVAFALLGAGRWGWRWAVATVILALGLLGDLQTLPIGVAAVAGAGIAAMLRERNWRAGAAPLAAGVASVPLALAIRWVAVRIGTFEIGAANPHASKHQMLANVAGLPRWLRQIFAIDGGGWGETGVPAGLAALHVISLIAVALAVIVALVGLVRAIVAGSDRSGGGSPEGDTPGTGTRPWLVDDMLLIGCAGGGALFLYGTTGNDPGFVRYLMPSVLLGSVLAGRLAVRLVARPPRVPRRARTVAACLGAAVVLAFAGASAAVLVRPVMPPGGTALTEFLAARDLHVGMGPYWAASILTVSSSDQVKVRPVIQGPDGKLHRRGQLSDAAWYEGTKFQFLLVNTKTGWDGVTVDSATATFGAPERIYHYGVYDVLVWAQPRTVSPAPFG